MLFSVLKVNYYEGDSDVDDDGRHRERRWGRKSIGEGWRRKRKQTGTKRKCKKPGQRGGRGISRGEAKRKRNISCDFS